MHFFFKVSYTKYHYEVLVLANESRGSDLSSVVQLLPAGAHRGSSPALQN